MFWKQRDLFAIAVAFAWLGTNLFEVATYAADARTMAHAAFGLLNSTPHSVTAGGARKQEESSRAVLRAMTVAALAPHR